MWRETGGGEMNMVWIAFFAGCILGGMVGFLTCSILTMGKIDDIGAGRY